MFFKTNSKFPTPRFSSLIFKYLTQKINYSLLMALTFYCSLAFGQQKTLGVTQKLNGSTENGYILFTPMICKTTYLIDMCGRQVHSWKSNYNPGFSVYLLPNGNLLRTGIAQDTFFNQGGKGGIIEILDWNGNAVWTYLLSNDSLAQHHDIYPMENGNILVISWHGIPENEALAKGRSKGSIGGSKLWSESIIEIKPVGKNSAQVVWRWNLWDHLIQDESISKPDYDTISNHPELMNINFAPLQQPDWIHFNSIDYNKELDQILLSCHNTSEIWIIDHGTTTAEAASHYGGRSNKGGDLLYRWGNPIAYGKGSKSNQKLYYQHNANWIPKGYKDGGDIMIFNNGLSRVPAYSSVDIIKPAIISPGNYLPNIPYGPIGQKWIYKDSVPESFFSPVFAGANRLRNGNTLVCSGFPGKLFEIDNNRKVVWEYINPVAGGDKIMTDGETGANSLFRCTYYSDSFIAFNGKSLTPSGPIEKKSYSYSCEIFKPDTMAPKPIAFLPDRSALNVSINTVLSLIFDEKIYRGIGKKLNIYDNNNLKETLPSEDAQVILNNHSSSFSLMSNFNYGSRISIEIEKGFFVDSAGNQIEKIDSSSWNFNTIRFVDINTISKIKNKAVYPNPTQRFINVAFKNIEPQIQLINNIGQVMDVGCEFISVNEITVDMKNCPSGIYSLLLTGKFSQLIMKQ